MSAELTSLEIRTAERRRARASSLYQPKQVDLLLVAESPPRNLGRYFYFEHVSRADYLFRAIVSDLLGEEPSRMNKAGQLAELQARGVFLIDLRPDPFDERSDNSLVDSLIKQVRLLAPKRAILIKVNVYDAAYSKPKDAGLPVIDVRLPFPSTGRQHEFSTGFRRAQSL